LRGDEPPVDEDVMTTVSRLQVAVLFDADGATSAVRQSGGHAVIESDETIWEAQRLLANEGLLVEPAGATALAGVIADVAAGRLTPTDCVVVVLTGAGWKDAEALARLAAANDVATIEPDEIAAALDSSAA
jgi:threonine synthase